jgi:hypothetical protein
MTNRQEGDTEAHLCLALVDKAELMMVILSIDYLLPLVDMVVAVEEIKLAQT